MWRSDDQSLYVRPACGAQTHPISSGLLLRHPPVGSVLCPRGACFSRLSHWTGQLPRCSFQNATALPSAKFSCGRGASRFHSAAVSQPALGSFPASVGVALGGFDPPSHFFAGRSRASSEAGAETAPSGAASSSDAIVGRPVSSQLPLASASSADHPPPTQAPAATRPAAKARPRGPVASWSSARTWIVICVLSCSAGSAMRIHSLPCQIAVSSQIGL